MRSLARNMSFFSASQLFRFFSLFHPCSSLQKQDSCRPPISRTRISPLKIFNFNTFLHRPAFTSRYIITALLHSPAYSRSVKKSGEEARTFREYLVLRHGPALENRLEGNIIFCDLLCRHFATCLVYSRMIQIQQSKKFDYCTPFYLYVLLISDNISKMLQWSNFSLQLNYF